MDRPAMEERGQVAVARCTRCGYANPIERFPLWFITGSGGSDNTTFTPLLRSRLPDCIVFEAELLVHGDRTIIGTMRANCGGLAPPAGNEQVAGEE